MPVSGNEETGVKSFAGQFSGLIAGVPIKKRRFPLIRPPSPLPEEPCSLTEETDLQRKEDSSISQGSTLSNASVAGAPIKKRRFPLLQASPSPSPSDETSPASPPQEIDALRKELPTTSQGSTFSTSSSCLSETNGNPVFEERKTSSYVINANVEQSQPGFVVPKLEEPNTGTESCTSDVMDGKEKVIVSEGNDKKLESQLIKENAELLLAAKESLALSTREDLSKQNVKVICKHESSVVPESTSLSLSLKENLFPAAASLKIDRSNPKIQKAEPVSLELSLSKEECSTHSLKIDAKTNSDASDVQSNRANWDLNTTMDAWEESGTETSSLKTSIDELKITSSMHDEQLMCSTGITQPADVVSAKQTSEEGQKKAFIVSSGLYGQHYKCVDQRDLCFTSFFQKYAEEPSRLPVKLNPGSNIPPVNLPSGVATSGDSNSSSFRLVKSEPFDENLKKVLKVANACPLGSLDSVAEVKQEFVQPSNIKCSKSSNVVNLKKVDSKSIKSEPGHKGNQERSNSAENKMHKLGKVLPQGSVNFSSSSAIPVTMVAAPVFAETACPPVKPSSSTELSISENIVSQLENCSRLEGVNVEKVCHGAYLTAEQIPSGVAMPTVNNGTELSDPDVKISSTITKDGSAEDRDDCRLKLMNEPPSNPRHSGEGCVSDEEKITLSADMLEDDCYGSDYESDDNQAVTIAVDTERYADDDDYEDGEVREPLEASAAEHTICEVREVEHPDCSNRDNKQVEKVDINGDCPTSSLVVENDDKTAVHSEINNEDVMDIEMHERPSKVVDKNVCLQESFDDEKSNTAADGKKLVDVLQRKPLDLPERKNVPEALQTELPSNQATKGSHRADDVQCADEVVKTTDTVKQPDLDLPKMETSANTDDATKDATNSGNQGRIIDLSRAASSSSPGKTRPISGRSLSSRAGRDVLSDTLDGDKLHRGRDEVYIDGPHKFSRDRHQDLSPRNSRLNFVRGRGRVNNRLDSLRSEWECDREFSGEFYNGPSQFRGLRPKYAPGIADSDMEYNNAPDGSYVGNGRLGRKPLNDGSYIPPRRRSPGGRDGIQMGHRNPRNISPNRCIGSDGSEMVGMRHSEKFMRSFPEDTLEDSMFTRPQPYEGMGGRFTRGGRSFSSIQRRGLPRIRSKSPIRSRSRSPGPWSSPRRRSPRRRSPEGFGGPPELTHRRSSLYRVDRMRSPDRPVFPGERVVRRHGSPSFMSRPSNDIRDMDSAREHGHPRSVISNRNPSGRILIRNRRFEVVDPRDRADNDDDYFGGPMHSGRILELSGEGNGEERRRFGERRGPVRSFRPPYNGGVSENFHLNAEEGPRHYNRFCSDDSDFHERGGNMRERDFDRRIKGRPANVPPRRTRNMDEQEENFRHGGQVWSDDSFDDISRVKRKRF